MSLILRIKAAWAVFNGAAAPPSPQPLAPMVAPSLSAPVLPNPPAELEASLARMRFDHEEAQLEIGRFREEFSRRERQAADEVAAAGRETLLRLARRVGPLLSQVATMRSLAAEGRPVRMEDVLAMTGKLEAAFADVGIAAIGQVGADAVFDPKLHQRMSGGDVTDGDPIRVRFVGFVCGETIVTKAMVSRKE